MEKEKEQVRDLRNGDWLWINKLVLENPYLTIGAKIVYCALAFFANNKTQKSYPSISKLSKLTSSNKSTIIRSIKKLEEYHFIKVEKNKGKISNYTLLKLTDSQPVAKSNQWQKEGKWWQIRNGVVANKETNNTNTILNNNKGFNYKTAKQIIKEKMSFK